MILFKTKTSETVRLDNGSLHGMPHQKYTADITGDGIQATFQINHSLDTEDIIFKMTDTSQEPVLIDFTIIDENNINILFSTAPSPAETYIVTIYAVKNTI